MLYVLTGSTSFDQTAFYCLIGALLFTPPAILTGLLSWWVNYMARPMRPVTIKKYGLLRRVGGPANPRCMEGFHPNGAR